MNITRTIVLHNFGGNDKEIFTLIPLIVRTFDREREGKPLGVKLYFHFTNKVFQVVSHTADCINIFYMSTN